MTTITDSDGEEYELDRRLTDSLESKGWAIGELLELLITKAGVTEAELRDCSILGDHETIAPEPVEPAVFEQFNDLAELLRTYSKAIGEGDPDVRQACDHLVKVFDAAVASADPREFFIDQLTKDASYSSWKGGK